MMDSCCSSLKSPIICKNFPSAAIMPKAVKLKCFSMFFSKCIKASLRVANAKGLHIRPATNISLLAKEYPQTTLKLSLRGRQANGKNINEILALSAAYQDVLLVEIVGPKAKRLLKRLKKVFADLEQYSGPINLDIERGYGRLL